MFNLFYYCYYYLLRDIYNYFNSTQIVRSYGGHPKYYKSKCVYMSISFRDENRSSYTRFGRIEHDLNLKNKY